MSSQAKEIFCDAAVLVYVLDVASSSPVADCDYFEECVRTLRSSSPDARVVVLLHKTDLLGEPEEAHRHIKQYESDVRRRALPTLAQCYATSIWDESLYKVLLPAAGRRLIPPPRRGRVSCQR